MKKIFALEDKFNHLKDVSLFFVRIVLAYGFYGPATMKWSNINGVAEWFSSMGLPLPTLQAYLAASAELLGVILLPLGLFTRWISIPLIITMIVAIKTVHWDNGFEASNNGFEIPLYYMLMLMVLLSHGAGKISIDHWLRKKFH
jgi:putative oxidoreductase